MNYLFIKDWKDQAFSGYVRSHKVEIVERKDPIYN